MTTTPITTEPFIEVAHYQQAKANQAAPGDVFASRIIGANGRTLCILADGLGSGIKAAVLARMTATMAMKFFTSEVDITRAAKIIMSTLPVCSERKIAYSTFTILDITPACNVSIIEYENPPAIILRNGKSLSLPGRTLNISTPAMANRTLTHYSFDAQINDRIVIFSDGLTQSGMGKPATPLGYSHQAVRQFIEDTCRNEPDISARKMSRLLVEKAMENDGYHPRDDITAATVNLRRPRKLLIVTGPPTDSKKDPQLAQTVQAYQGKRIICGGTTAQIISKQLSTPISVDLKYVHSDIPPPASMPGTDLITEGTLTLNRTAELIETGADIDKLRPNSAVLLLRQILDADIVDFLVGTKINQAHQDPNLPLELDIRRNLIKRLANLLQQTYLKKTTITYI